MSVNLGDRFRGKVAIVTGSSSGIGRGIAERFASEGAKVVVNARHADKVARAAEAIRAAGGEVIGVAADVGYAEEVDRLFQRALEAFGTVDVLVNNAGWANPEAHILEMSEEHWDNVQRSNLKSVYLCTHRMANLLVDQHKTGSIISISSFGAARSHRYMAAYDATKGGIESFTRAVSIDLAPFGIRVNAVGPGAIHTESTDDDTPEKQAKRAANVPLGRVGFPADIAGAVLFLASDDASYITGQVLYVDGGALAQLRNPQVDPPLPPDVAARLWRK